jgi:hypothetical protein
MSELKRRRPKEYAEHEYVKFITRRMRLLGMNQVDLVRLTGLSDSNISFLLTGVTNPYTMTNHSHLAISRALRVNVEVLLTKAGIPLREFPDDATLEDVLQELSEGLSDGRRLEIKRLST